MKPLIVTIRTLAVLLGLSWVAASVLDISGLLPHPEAPPPLAKRMIHSVPLVMIGGLLAFPYRLVRTERMRPAIATGLALVVAWTLYLSVGGAREYLAGEKSWHVVPAGLLLTALAVANLWAFIRITKGARAALR